MRGARTVGGCVEGGCCVLGAGRGGREGSEECMYTSLKGIRW